MLRERRQRAKAMARLVCVDSHQTRGTLASNEPAVQSLNLGVTDRCVRCISIRPVRSNTRGSGAKLWQRHAPGQP